MAEETIALTILLIILAIPATMIAVLSVEYWILGALLYIIKIDAVLSNQWLTEAIRWVARMLITFTTYIVPVMVGLGLVQLFHGYLDWQDLDSQMQLAFWLGGYLLLRLETHFDTRSVS